MILKLSTFMHLNSFVKKSAKIYFSLLGISNVRYSAKVEPYTCVCIPF